MSDAISHLRERWDEIQLAEALDRHDRIQKDIHNLSGGSSGGGDLDTRLTNLERDMTEVKVAIGKVETRIEHIERQMLTKGQTAVYALLAGIAVFGAGWWVVQQYLAPLVASLPK